MTLNRSFRNTAAGIFLAALLTGFSSTMPADYTGAYVFQRPAKPLEYFHRIVITQQEGERIGGTLEVRSPLDDIDGGAFRHAFTGTLQDGTLDITTNYIHFPGENHAYHFVGQFGEQPPFRPLAPVLSGILTVLEDGKARSSTQVTLLAGPQP